MTNLFDLTGKKAIVTGGTRGLGHGMAEGLMEAGAEVVIFGSNEKVYTVAEAFCQKGFSCIGIAVDLSDCDSRRMAFLKAVELLGGLDILVNCAGIQRRHKSEEFPLADWQDVLNVNLTAPFELCQMAAKEFMAHGKKGKIINISSMLAFFGGFTVPAYAASKGGVTQMTKAFCNEWAGKGINVNCIAPGYMDTEMNAALTDPANPRYAEITDRIPAHRWGTGEDMKGAVIFLASAASDYLNGALIPVDGGYLVK
ncbi:MAG: SDR family NAD(P)-dependent oxidoreductase [Lachnospiraceae bacterium]|jgi:2-deoxy-D-gluconate 3-dehydrogenase|nr:SDR family NAD(P)-dependent oxidoreductase [Lachnospiraceae bacterium]